MNDNPGIIIVMMLCAVSGFLVGVMFFGAMGVCF
jgi:hypothetical protein